MTCTGEHNGIAAWWLIIGYSLVILTTLMCTPKCDARPTPMAQQQAASDDESPTFFVQRTTQLGPVAMDTVLTFDNVTLNVGEGFNQTTSQFVAPVTGNYYMTYSFHSDYAFVDMYQNHIRIREDVVDSPRRRSYGSSTLILHLLKGDSVGFELKARGMANTLDCDITTCEFSGYLLTEKQYRFRKTVFSATDDNTESGAVTDVAVETFI